MLALTLLTLATCLVGTFAGWAGHWALHKPWAGRFFKAHLKHHRLYPPKSLLSVKYREPGKEDTTLILAPIITVAVLAWLAFLGWTGVPWIHLAYMVGMSATLGFLHEWLHQAFHLEGHWLGRFKWFKALQRAHFEHHRDARINLGIVWFGWDRLFKRFH